MKTEIEKFALLKFPVKIRSHNGKTVEHNPRQVDVNYYRRKQFVKYSIELQTKYEKELKQAVIVAYCANGLKHLEQFSDAGLDISDAVKQLKKDAEQHYIEQYETPKG